VGKDKPISVVSGLAEHYTVEQLIGKKVVVLVSLPPRNLRGTLSEGMVLCASTEGKVELLQVEGKVGERVKVVGDEKSAFEPTMNPKQKVWESIQADLKTNNKCVACWKGKEFNTRVTASTLVNATIK